MGFLDKLKSLFAGGGGGGGETQAQAIYLRCKVCGEPLQARVDLRNDLSPQWSDAGGSDYPDHYSTHKTVIGTQQCYAPIELDITYDRRKQVESEHVTGGTILTEEEYRQALAEWEAKGNAAQ